MFVLYSIESEGYQLIMKWKLLWGTLLDFTWGEWEKLSVR